MNRQKRSSIVLFWLVTGISAFLAYYTYMLKGMPFESGIGSLVFGFFLFLYLCWFICDTFWSDQTISWTEAVKFNLSRNPAVWSIYGYWAIFLLLPISVFLFTDI